MSVRSGVGKNFKGIPSFYPTDTILAGPTGFANSSIRVVAVRFEMVRDLPEEGFGRLGIGLQSSLTKNSSPDNGARRAGDWPRTAIWEVYGHHGGGSVLGSAPENSGCAVIQPLPAALDRGLHDLVGF